MATVEALTARFEPLLGVQIRLQHALVVKHIAHGLGDDHVHLLCDVYLLDLPGDHLDDMLKVVGRYQTLGGRGRDGFQ